MESKPNPPAESHCLTNQNACLSSCSLPNIYISFIIVFHLHNCSTSIAPEALILHEEPTWSSHPQYKQKYERCSYSISYCLASLSAKCPSVTHLFSGLVIFKPTLIAGNSPNNLHLSRDPPCKMCPRNSQIFLPWLA